MQHVELTQFWSVLLVAKDPPSAAITAVIFRQAYKIDDIIDIKLSAEDNLQ